MKKGKRRNEREKKVCRGGKREKKKMRWEEEGRKMRKKRKAKRERWVLREQGGWEGELQMNCEKKERKEGRKGE